MLGKKQARWIEQGHPADTWGIREAEAEDEVLSRPSTHLKRPSRVCGLYASPLVSLPVLIWLDFLSLDAKESQCGPKGHRPCLAQKAFRRRQ